ncbi:MAG: putative quinol monooxygenase [Anaerolineae bacterium]
MYGLMGKFQIQAGQREVMLKHLLDAAKILRAMDGCYVYVISAAVDDANTIWITEVWRSKEDHAASLQHEGVRAIISAARPLIAAPPEGFEIDPRGGVGLPE